ncbi:hypothetical protein OPT61_g3095 [Boeremia exigua]|uniref:Uncharacterized protein n=1 Tax=Boeremia exigua TaxID=749465 RepID=A0ACC2IJB1_9PLEO|nr:hypothetical protein OPT61_g3095 [Boeremia exigua]
MLRLVSCIHLKAPSSLRGPEPAAAADFMDSANSSSDPSRAPAKIRRKSHRKSRNGCARCKRRRIKCDETKPECARCVEFGTVCDYNTAAPLLGSQPLERSRFLNIQGAPIPKPRGRPRTIWSDETSCTSPPEDLSLSLRNPQRFFPDTKENLEDFELLNHFITRPNDNPDSTVARYVRDPLHDQALLLSFAYPCILHLIQEFSALELAQQQPWRRAYYHVLAGRHSLQGLEGAGTLLSHLKESDYHAAYTAATLASINFLARGPQLGEYLLFSWGGRPQWLPLLHGIRTIIDLAGIERLAAGPTSRAPQRIEPAKEPARVMLKCTDLDWVGQFQRLHALVASSPDFVADADSLRKLEWCYEATYGRDGVFKGDANMQNAFIWPFQLGEDFTALAKGEKISRSLHHISIRNSLLPREIAGLKEVLGTQEKHRNKCKALGFQPREDYHGGAEFYFPSRVEKACSDERSKQQNQKAEELRKAEMKKLRHANKLYNESIAQERREQEAREKEERKRVRAEKAKEAAERKAQRERDRQARNAEKASKLPQRDKCKASQSVVPEKKQKRGTVAARRGVVAVEPPAAPRTHTTRSGRTAALFNELVLVGAVQRITSTDTVPSWHVQGRTCKYAETALRRVMHYGVALHPVQHYSVYRQQTRSDIVVVLTRATGAPERLDLPVLVDPEIELGRHSDQVM